jgi:hypothetical protein
MKPPRFDTTDFDQINVTSPELPEKRLMIAMIQRAMYDYTHPVRGKAHLAFDAAAWLFSSDTKLMSLHWICATLSDYPESLRASIQKAARSGKMKTKTVIFRVDTRG